MLDVKWNVWDSVKPDLKSGKPEGQSRIQLTSGNKGVESRRKLGQHINSRIQVIMASYTEDCRTFLAT